MSEEFEVGQIWRARTRTKTITYVQPGVCIGYIDSKDNKEWFQQWVTFKAWIEITRAELEVSKSAPKGERE